MRPALTQDYGRGVRRALRDERVVARDDRARRIIGDERDAVRLAQRRRERARRYRRMERTIFVKRLAVHHAHAVHEARNARRRRSADGEIGVEPAALGNVASPIEVRERDRQRRRIRRVRIRGGGQLQARHQRRHVRELLVKPRKTLRKVRPEARDVRREALCAEIVFLVVDGIPPRGVRTTRLVQVVCRLVDEPALGDAGREPVADLPALG